MDNIKTQIQEKEIRIELSDKVFLNKNYLRLSNKPSINGVELVGNKTSTELNLLTNNLDTYKEITIESVDKTDFLLLTNTERTTKKMALGEITSHLTHTAEIIPKNLEIGSYIFLLKENKNGTDKK